MRAFQAFALRFRTIQELSVSHEGAEVFNVDKALRKLPHLRRMDLSNVAIDLTSLDFTAFSKLQSISFSWCKGLTNDYVQSLSGAMRSNPTFEHVQIDGLVVASPSKGFTPITSISPAAELSAPDPQT